MPEFKVGDRVRVVRQPDDIPFKNGDVGTIVRAWEDRVGEGMVDFQKDGVDYTFNGFFANRFELIAEAPAVPKFKKGDRVKLVNNEGLTRERFPIGSLATVAEDSHKGGGGVEFVRIDYDHYPTRCDHRVSRFELVAPRPFQVGDKVKVVKKVLKEDGWNNVWTRIMEEYVNNEKEYTILRITRNGIQFAEDGMYLWPHGALAFADAQAVEKKPEPPILKPEHLRKGDKVFIIRKVENNAIIACRWNEAMNKMLKDGVEYQVSRIGADGSILLSNGWWYTADCLAFVVAPKKQRKPKKVAPPSLRVALRNKIAKELHHNGICSFAMQTANGDQHFQINGPCHAALGYLVGSKSEVTELAYGLDYEVQYILHNNKELLKQHKPYVKYILNESPWAKCFLTKNVATAYRYDILMDVSQSRHHVAAACIALREGSEFSEKLKLFNLLLKKGFSGNTAYLLSWAFIKRADGGLYTFGAVGGGHTTLYRDLSAEGLLKFFREGYYIKTDGEPFSKNHGNYRITKFIADDKGEAIIYWLINEGGMQQVGDGWNKTYTISEKNLLALAAKIDKLIKG